MDDKDKSDSEINEENAADKSKDDVEKDIEDKQKDKSKTKDKCEDVKERAKKTDSEKSESSKESEPTKDTRRAKSKKDKDGEQESSHTKVAKQGSSHSRGAEQGSSHNKDGEQSSSQSRVAEQGSSHTRGAEQGSSHNRDGEQVSSQTKEGEDGDTGEETSSSSSGFVRFKKLKLNHRNYRSQEDLPSLVEDYSSSDDEPPSDDKNKDNKKTKEADNAESSTSSSDSEDEVINLQQELSSSSSSTIEFDDGEARDQEDSIGGRRVLRLGMEDTSDSDDDENGNGMQEDAQIEAQAEQDADQILNRSHHNPTFNLATYTKIHVDVVTAKRRKLQNSIYGSIPIVQRLHVNYKLEGHEGCVNSLHFNQSGSKLASGSDDLMIIVWDWQHKKKLTSFPTGHRENVFQSKFLPGDLLIASCSRDGQVRLAELCPAGSLRSTLKLSQHRGSVHKLALVDDNHVILSAGEDAQVLICDTREQKTDKLLLLKNNKDKKIPIYSIHTNPANQNQFLTAGREHYIRVFDRRYINAFASQELMKFCPRSLRNADSMRAYITCAVFSYDGKEVIGSYSDEDIYLFKTSDGDGAEHVKQYKGHRNSATVKGVNFFGPRSEYVISGSDCGNVFFWSKETESVVNISKGDENGVVNVLEPHPTIPVLATSGLDEDVKIWFANKPVTDEDDQIHKNKQFMRKTIKKNLMDRLDKSDDADSIYGHLLYQLWNNLRRVEQRRSAGGAATATGADGDGDGGEGGEGDEEESSEDEDDDGPRRHQCAQS